MKWEEKAGCPREISKRDLWWVKSCPASQTGFFIIIAQII
jgi:hypothetical protein